jgi:hypothetical protein
MKGGMTLGVGEHDYPEFKNTGAHHADEANQAVDEIETRMNQLVELEKNDVGAMRGKYQQLRKLELEFLLADAVPHIVFQMAASIRPHTDVSDLIGAFKTMSHHYNHALHDFKKEHNFVGDEHYHNRHATETRRRKRGNASDGEPAAEDLIDFSSVPEKRDDDGPPDSDSASDRSAARTDPFSPRSGGPATHGPVPVRGVSDA